MPDLVVVSARHTPLLRRTKEQVAPELPDRIEEELAVELTPRHRRVHDTLLARERSRVLGLFDDDSGAFAQALAADDIRGLFEE